MSTNQREHYPFTPEVRKGLTQDEAIVFRAEGRHPEDSEGAEWARVILKAFTELAAYRCQQDRELGDLELARDRIRDSLVEAAKLAVVDVLAERQAAARRCADLAQAYVTLGGDLELPKPEPEPVPARLVVQPATDELIELATTFVANLPGLPDALNAAGELNDKLRARLERTDP